MKLPIPFIERMQKQLGTDFPLFIESYDKPVHVGLRVNTSKISISHFIEIFPYKLMPIPWVTGGFYYNPNDPVTKHPYYHAGLYYVQEPSAMAPAEVLNPSEGSTCIDLCAAPGGKSTQLAVKIGPKGVLVSNDISDKRIKAIVRNVEKFGLGNVVILNESPERIASVMGNRFNYVLVDAPCSGEGMFKKDLKAVHAWENFGPSQCQILQTEIVDTVPDLIRKNSRLVYSTCTFALEENETQMAYLKASYSIFKPGKFPELPIDIEGESAHIWPHKHKGEGHFVGCLETTEMVNEVKLEFYEANQPPTQLQAFFDSHMQKTAPVGHFEVIKDRVYLKPDHKLPLSGLKIAREGLLLGEIKREKFIPHQAFALYLKAEDFEPRVDFPSDSLEVIKYLKGETLIQDFKTDGFHLVTTDGFPLGWAKISGGVLKNMYPPSWRML